MLLPLAATALCVQVTGPETPERPRARPVSERERTPFPVRAAEEEDDEVRASSERPQVLS